MPGIFSGRSAVAMGCQGRDRYPTAPTSGEPCGVPSWYGFLGTTITSDVTCHVRRNTKRIDTYPVSYRYLEMANSKYEALAIYRAINYVTNNVPTQGLSMSSNSSNRTTSSRTRGSWSELTGGDSRSMIFILRYASLIG